MFGGGRYERLRLLNRLAKLGPECASMSRALLIRSVAVAHEMLDLYDASDEADKESHRAFCDGGGPRMCHELRVEHEDGTPTSGDLDSWLK